MNNTKECIQYNLPIHQVNLKLNQISVACTFKRDGRSETGLVMINMAVFSGGLRGWVGGRTHTHTHPPAFFARFFFFIVIAMHQSEREREFQTEMH